MKPKHFTFSIVLVYTKFKSNITWSFLENSDFFILENTVLHMKNTSIQTSTVRICRFMLSTTHTDLLGLMPTNHMTSIGHCSKQLCLIFIPSDRLIQSALNSCLFEIPTHDCGLLYKSRTWLKRCCSSDTRSAHKLSYQEQKYTQQCTALSLPLPTTPHKYVQGHLRRSPFKTKPLPFSTACHSQQNKLTATDLLLS